LYIFQHFCRLFEEVKNAEKNAQFISSDEAQINALQNKKNNIPIKREKNLEFTTVLMMRPL